MKRIIQSLLLACLVPLMSNAADVNVDNICCTTVVNRTCGANLVSEPVSEVVTYNPEPGQIKELFAIEVTYSAGITLGVDDENYNGIVVTNSNTGEQVSASYILDEINDTTCEINFNPAVRDKGLYNVHIPAGVFLLGDKQTPNEECNLTYRVCKDTACAGTYTLLIPEGFFTYQSDDLEPAWYVTGETAEAHATTFGSTTGITGVDVNAMSAKETYNLAGQKVNTPVSGTVNIVRNANEAVKKVLVK